MDTRRGRRTSSPPQFGHTASIEAVQPAQNVHSKLQMYASPASSSAAPQRSHAVRISSANALAQAATSRSFCDSAIA